MAWLAGWQPGWPFGLLDGLAMAPAGAARGRYKKTAAVAIKNRRADIGFDGIRAVAIKNKRAFGGGRSVFLRHPPVHLQRCLCRGDGSPRRLSGRRPPLPSPPEKKKKPAAPGGGCDQGSAGCDQETTGFIRFSGFRLRLRSRNDEFYKGFEAAIKVAIKKRQVL